MKAYDFVYDNKNLSEFGMVLCNFGNKGLETIDNGSKVTFETVPSQFGIMNNLVSTRYDDCLEATVQIAKASCTTDVEEIPSPLLRELTRWLSRRKFLKLKILDEEHIDLYYLAKIDVSRIEINGKVYGLELNITTNAPFPLKEPKTIIRKNSTNESGEWHCSINDTSYEEGYMYPVTEITIENGGDLEIYNALEDRKTTIKNCTAGEIIKMDYPVIQSSDSSHNIQNDFNWNFFRIANTYNNSRNDLTVSIPCTIKIKYSPIVKVGL